MNNNGILRRIFCLNQQFLFFYCSITVVPIFPITLLTLPIPTSHIQFPHVVFVHGSFIHVPWQLFSFFPPLSRPPFPLVTVSLFFISMSLVLFCSLAWFVGYGPLIGEIIWYLSFTAWHISLSIMLSSSIHAVMKGRSSFFLSAA